jgi:ATP-binding cassette subfamily B (MDR/TAP) protein 1
VKFLLVYLIFRSLSTANTTNLLSLSEAIKPLLHFYILLGSLSIFFSWIAWTCWIIAAERQVRRIRYKLFRSILRQEIGWFDVHNAGELSNRLINDLGKYIHTKITICLIILCFR